MAKKEFSFLLASKTGVLQREYYKLFLKYEEATNTDLDSILESRLPARFDTLSIFHNLQMRDVAILRNDLEIAKELGVSVDAVAGLRTFNESLREWVNDASRENVNFASFNDYQKGLATSISYLNVTDEGMDKIKNGGLTINELKDYLANPGARFVGNPVMFDGISKTATDWVAGKDNVITDLDVYNELIKNGMGDLKITDIKNITSSGFTAVTIEDKCDNKAISYRGSDFDYKLNVANDWLTDACEYLTDDSLQARQAKAYFNEMYEEGKGMYIYGHSLGGSLVNHVFAENYDKIDEAFSFCGIPISETKLDTDEKIAAFNSDKYSCYAVVGDVVSNLRSYDMYKDNVHFIKCVDDTSFISSHVLQTAALDENNNFVLVSREEAIESMKDFNRNFAGLATNAKVVIDDFKEKINSTFKIDSDTYVTGAINLMCKACTFAKDEIIEIGNGASKIANDIKTGINNVADGVKDTVNNIKDWAGDKFNDFKEAAEDLFEK